MRDAAYITNLGRPPIDPGSDHAMMQSFCGEPIIARIMSFEEFGPEGSSRIILDSGDVVLVAIRQGVVSISKRRWKGLLGIKLLWRSRDVAHSLELFAIALEAGSNVLLYVVELIAHCESAADVRAVFQRIERGEQQRSKAWH